MRKFISKIAVLFVLIFISSTAAAGYNSSLRHTTKSGRLFNYETWDAEIIWHAVFFGDDFIHDFEEKHIQVNHLNPIEAANFVGEQERKHAKNWDFFLVFYTKKDYKKFTNDPDSFWKIHLTTASGEEVKPDSIESIPVTPYVRVMYRKQINRWSRAYRVSFPKVDLGDKFSLQIESVIGKSELNWKLR